MRLNNVNAMDKLSDYIITTELILIFFTHQAIATMNDVEWY